MHVFTAGNGDLCWKHMPEKATRTTKNTSSRLKAPSNTLNWLDTTGNRVYIMIYFWWSLCTSCLVAFGESYGKRLRPFLLCLCDACPVLITSLVCWLYNQFSAQNCACSEIFLGRHHTSETDVKPARQDKTRQGIFLHGKSEWVHAFQVQAQDAHQML